MNSDEYVVVSCQVSFNGTCACIVELYTVLLSVVVDILIFPTPVNPFLARRARLLLVMNGLAI